MEAMILDRNFNNVITLDNFQSFIWTDKYRGYGDFEIYSPPTDVLLQKALQNYYVWFRDSDRLMIIEDREIQSSVEQGHMLSITGRSLESILERRHILKKIKFKGDIQDLVQRLIQDNVLTSVGNRPPIDRFIFERDPDLEINMLPDSKDHYVEVEYYGENLYEKIEENCALFDIGFKITLQKRKDNNGIDHEYFVMRLYKGTDRSYEQDVRPSITFSTKFENLLSSNFYSSYRLYKNVAYAATRNSDTDTGYEHMQYYYPDKMENIPSGLDWRETFVECSVDKDEDWRIIQKNEAMSKLKEAQTTDVFDGQLDPLGQYRYGRDFNIGDIVQIANEYGMEGESRVVSVTFSSEPSGESIYPTFEKID